MKPILDILVGVAFASFGQLFLKMGTNSAGEISIMNPASLLNAYIILGLACYASGTLFWLIALSKADLSYVYPFTALTFVIVYLLSAFVLKEPSHLNRLLGTLLIAAGVCILVLFG